MSPTASGSSGGNRRWYWIAGIGGCLLLLSLCIVTVAASYFFWGQTQLAQQTPDSPKVIEIEREVTRIVRVTEVVESQEVIEKEVTRIVEVPKIEATVAPEQTQPVEATQPPEVSDATAVPEQATPISRPPARPASIHLKTGQTTTLADGWTWICIGHFSVKAPDGREFNHYHDGGIHMGLITVLQADSKARLSGPDGMPDGVPIGDCIPVSVNEKNDKIAWAIDIELGRGCTGSGCDVVRVVEIDRNYNIISDELK